MPEVFDIMLNVIAPIFFIVGLSALFSRRTNPNPRAFSSVVIYLFLPFLVFRGISQSEISGSEILQILTVAASIPLGMTVIGLLISRLLKLNRRQESAFVLSIILVNAANYGIPLNEFAFGIESRQYTLVYYVASAIIANTFGVYFASRGAASSYESMLNIFKLPMIYAALIGLIVNLGEITIHPSIQKSTDLLANAAIPGMLTVLGMQLAHISIRGRTKLILLAASSRLVIGPVIAVSVAFLLGMSGLSRQVAIVEASMPTAVMAGIFATQFDADSELVTSVIIVATLGSILSLSILLSFFI